MRGLVFRLPSTLEYFSQLLLLFLLLSSWSLNLFLASIDYLLLRSLCIVYNDYFFDCRIDERKLLAVGFVVVLCGFVVLMPWSSDSPTVKAAFVGMVDCNNTRHQVQQSLTCRSYYYQTENL